MLTPEDRLLLTDALRPPEGHRVDIAVATTYSLDLTSLLLAPMSMAAYDQTSESGIEGVDAMALLESIRRHADRTTVFCQAGGIHVPSGYQKLSTFAEGCVIEARPRLARRVFHPKIWALRFDAADGSLLHRLVCLSRNLTGDRSWDTVLVCDEDAEAVHQMDAAPLAGFLREIAELSVRPVPAARLQQIHDLADSLATTSLAVPPPFTAAEMLPLGTPSGGAWPLPRTSAALAVISPFLDVGAVARLPAARGAALISRPEAFDRLGGNALTDIHQILVLQPLADTREADEDEVTDSAMEVRTGLHAKVFAWDEGRTGHLVTGSANCTGAAFGGNIEFDVHLSGPASTCGASAMLAHSNNPAGLVRMLEPYKAVTDTGADDPRYALELQIEACHADIASMNPQLQVSTGRDGFDLQLQVELPAEMPGHTQVRPISLPKRVQSKPLALPLPTWHDVSLINITPFLALSTTIESDGLTVTRDCVITAELHGVPEDRSRQVLRALLAREEDILRYLVLLLGDPSLDDMLSRLATPDKDDEEHDKKYHRGGPSFDDLILLEPLVRAAARDDESLRRAYRLLEDLRDDEGNLPIVSADFRQLWQVVWEARQTA